MKGLIHISILCLLSALFLLSSKNAQGQDIHYTQFTLQPLQQSPAFAGNFNGDHRFAALYRNQWATIAVPYNTLGFAYDSKVYTTKKFDSFLSAGGQFFFDQAGDSRLRSLYLQLPVSYTLYLPAGEGNTFKLGTGFYVGLLNKSFNTSQLQFDNQYTGDIFNPNIPIAENFDQLGFTKPDIGLGYQLGLNLKEKTAFGIGFGIHHLNRIEESFINDGVGISLAKRYALPAYFKTELTPVWDLRFDYLYQTQNTFSEHTVGALASYFIRKDGPAIKSIEFGTYYRWADALSGIVRYQLNNMLFAFSYDINTSKLQAATNGYGGIEIGMVYTIKQVKEPQIKYKRKCVVF